MAAAAGTLTCMTATTIVAAMLAAGASIVAAVLSWRSAQDSRREARAALRVNQLVSAHDREVERFRDDVSGFVRALVAAGMEGEGGTVAGAAVIAMNSLCTEDLRKMANELAQLRMGRTAAGIDDLVHQLEDESRAILRRADNQRRTLLA